MNGELDRQRKPRGNLGRLLPCMTGVFPQVTSRVKQQLLPARNQDSGAYAAHSALFLGARGSAVVFRRVREAEVTTNCYHWPFLGEIRKGKYLRINWLPPGIRTPIC